MWQGVMSVQTGVWGVCGSRGWLVVEREGGREGGRERERERERERVEGGGLGA